MTKWWRYLWGRLVAGNKLQSISANLIFGSRSPRRVAKSGKRDNMRSGEFSNMLYRTLLTSSSVWDAIDSLAPYESISPLVEKLNQNQGLLDPTILVRTSFVNARDRPCSLCE